MKLAVKVAIVCLVVVAAGVAVAHHMAAGIVDEDVYAMIDALVADTPHATIDFPVVPPGMTEIDITAVTVVSLERMVADGLLGYAAMLDGTVTVTMEFDGGRDVDVIILQEE